MKSNPQQILVGLDQQVLMTAPLEVVHHLHSHRLNFCETQEDLMYEAEKATYLRQEVHEVEVARHVYSSVEVVMGQKRVEAKRIDWGLL